MRGHQWGLSYPFISSFKVCVFHLCCLFLIWKGNGWKETKTHAKPSQKSNKNCISWLNSQTEVLQNAAFEFANFNLSSWASCIRNHTDKWWKPNRFPFAEKTFTECYWETRARFLKQTALPVFLEAINNLKLTPCGIYMTWPESAI